MFCGGGVLVTIRATVIDVFVDLGNDVRHHFAATEDVLQVAFFFIVKALMYFRSL